MQGSVGKLGKSQNGRKISWPGEGLGSGRDAPETIASVRNFTNLLLFFSFNNALSLC